jgi:hypothetical protein
MQLPKPLRGIIPPLVTPLLDGDTLDARALERVIEHVVGAGVAGLFLLGTTGEGPALSYRLRREMIERATAQVGVVGDLHRSPPRPLRQISLSLRLQLPCNPPEQVLLVPGSRFLAQDFQVFLAQLCDRHVPELFNLFHHCWFQSFLLSPVG